MTQSTSQASGGKRHHFRLSLLAADLIYRYVSNSLIQSSKVLKL
jgi:hypothetical protein